MNTYRIMLESMRQIGFYAEKNNSIIAIETGPEPAMILKEFIEDAETKGIGVNMDPANLIMVLDEDPVEAVRTLSKYIVYTHAKDGVHYRKCDTKRIYDAFAEGGFDRLLAETGELFAEKPIGTGSVKWEIYLKALQDIGYKGFLTV